MSIVAVLAAIPVLTEEPKAPLLLPPIGFALVAFGIFLVLGVITWTFRDVSNRHAVKAAMTHHDDHQHGSAGHMRSGDEH